MAPERTKRDAVSRRNKARPNVPRAQQKRRPEPREAGPQRIAKLLARAGVASRRDIERMIADGRIAINGETLTTPATLLDNLSGVTVDGKPVKPPAAARLFRFYKPQGTLTAARDPKGRPTIYDRLPQSLPRLMPVGRLDFMTEGLLLLTNDGELTHRLTHPSFGVEKEYLAEVVGTPSPAAVRRLREGVDLEDGRTAPARVAVVPPRGLRIVVHEGRNRQVRRMCEAVGHPVVRLVRTRIGPLADRDLAPGEWRELSIAEVRGLDAAARRIPNL